MQLDDEERSINVAIPAPLYSLPKDMPLWYLEKIYPLYGFQMDQSNPT